MGFFRSQNLNLNTAWKLLIKEALHYALLDKGIKFNFWYSFNFTVLILFQIESNVSESFYCLSVTAVLLISQ